MKTYKQFVNKLNEGTITWFRGFSKASDDFMDLLDAVLKSDKEGFSKAVNQFVLEMSKGDRPSVDLFRPLITDDFYHAYYEIGMERGLMAYNFDSFYKLIKSKNADEIFPKMLYRGVMSDMEDGGSNLREYTTGEAKDYLDSKSVERGKQKFSVMLQNKGIIKEED